MTTAFLAAQPQPFANFNPRFEVFELPGGDPGNSVNCIVQDSAGFLWFGSQQGLHRYDGQHVHTYFHDPADSASIASDYIEWLFPDSKGILWIGHGGAGVSAFDPLAEIAARYAHDPKNPGSLSNNNVSMIAEDREGFIWCATNKGLNRLDRQTGKFRHFFHGPADPRSLSYDLVRSVYVDRQGTLWAGCGVVFNGNHAEGKLGGLNRYHPDGTFTRYLHDPNKPNSLADNRVRAIFEDSRGDFWVGTGSTGLHRMDRNAGTFERLPFDPAHPSRLSSPVLVDNESPFPAFYQVHFVSEDREGRLWVGALEGGLNVYDPASDKQWHFEITPGKIESLPSNYPWHFCQTRDGSVWLSDAGFGHQVWRVKNAGSLFPYFRAENLGLKSATFPGILKGRDGMVWVQVLGEFEGVIRFDPKTGATQRFPYDPPLGERGWLDFQDLGTDPMGNIWASTDHGLYKLGRSEAATAGGRFRLDTFLANRIQFKVLRPPFFDSKGNTWVPSFGDGLYRFGPGGKLTHFRHDPADPNSLGGNQVENVFEDSRGNLWAHGGGIGEDTLNPLFFDRFDPEKGAFIHFVPPGEFGDPVSAIEDINGNFWLTAYPFGICKIDPRSRGFKKLTSSTAGLFDHRIPAMALAQDGNIWMAAQGLIMELNPETEAVCSYSAQQGVQILDFEWMAQGCRGADGEILFAGKGGFHAFYPENIHKAVKKAPPIIRITRFETSENKKSPPAAWLWEEASAMKLPHGQNNFSLNVACFDFSEPALVRLEYMLENYDKDWRSDLLNGKATYVNVPPGHYTFKARGANSFGIWNREGASLRIVVLPPWWRTWWACSLWASLIFGVLYAIYRIRLHDRLEHAEAVRLRELDAFKTRLYTNITHEFRTPLTVISGMADQVKENPKEWFSEGLKMIKRNSSRLLALVNQMLDLSKLETGRLSLHYQQGDIVNFLKYLVESFHSSAAGKGVQLHFLSDLDAIMMDFDAERLQQAISNLLANAIKFTPAGGNVYLRIAMDDWQMPPPGSMANRLPFIIIRITDTGIGIPAEHLPYIFDRFYQVGDISSRHGEGTGIGLALAKELINLMGGEIPVRSTLGKGTEFIIRLPVTNEAGLKPSDAMATASPAWPFLKESEAGKAPSGSDPQSPVDKPLVLIAEDNPDVVTYLASCLAGAYRLSIANDGQECVDIAFARIPDLIVTDVMMPQKDGFEVCQILKNDERTSHIPIVVLTAKADMESRLAGLEQGADAYLAKPFHKHELLVEIKKLLNLRQKLQRHYRRSAGLAAEAVAQEETPKPEAMEDYFVKKARKAVEAHLDDVNFSADELCREIHLSHSQMHRKLHALTGYSATRFIRLIRLNKAKELLKKPELTITSVAFDTGFSDVGYFGKVFRQEFGMPPSEWREQFLKG